MFYSDDSFFRVDREPFQSLMKSMNDVLQSGDSPDSRFDTYAKNGGRQKIKQVQMKIISAYNIIKSQVPIALVTTKWWNVKVRASFVALLTYLNNKVIPDCQNNADQVRYDVITMIEFVGTVVDQLNQSLYNFRSQNGLQDNVNAT